MSVPPSTSSMLAHRPATSAAATSRVTKSSTSTEGTQPSTDFRTMTFPKELGNHAEGGSAKQGSVRPASRRESNTSTLMAVGKWNAWRERLFS
jgi:hypothetical protein